MPYCSRCGVEVDIEIKRCPLCSTDIQLLPPEINKNKKYPSVTAPKSIAPKRNKKEIKKMAAILVTFGLLIPASITITADMVINKTVTWGTYAISAVAYTWILVLLTLLYYKKPAITLLGYYSTTVLFLYTVDFLNNGIYWFYTMALPISTLTTTLTAVIIYIANRSRVKGINILSYTIMAIGIECLGIDLSTTLFLTGSIQLSWSIIVFAATVPAAGLLYYIYHKTRKSFKMKEYFHI